MSEVRKHIVFHGRVQGVGFRYTAKYAASSLELTGWARNEYDGTVTMASFLLSGWMRKRSRSGMMNTDLQ